MDSLLWALQVILAIKMMSVAVTHSLGRNGDKMRQAREKMGAPSAVLLPLVAVASVVVAAGLVAPAVVAATAGLVPVAAGVLSAMLLASIAAHTAAREAPNIPVSLILFAMSAFVAYGRMALAPLGS